VRIRPISDLHIEAGDQLELKPAGEDLIVLAGDIAMHVESVAIARQFAAQTGAPVLLISGNHEFYRDRGQTHTWESTLHDLRDAADHTDVVEPGCVTFLENSSVIYHGARFIGATLWTDMNLFGDDDWVRLIVARQIPDYEFIYLDKNKNLSIEHVMARHALSRSFLRDRLTEPFDGPTMTVTHHAPSLHSIPERYRGDKMSAAFASSLDEMIAALGPTLWVHGHTHQSLDYRLGNTRVVCNPRGYRGRDRNRQFNPNLLVEI